MDGGQVATVAGRIRSGGPVLVATEVPDDLYRRIRLYQARNHLTQDAFVALVTQDGARALSPATVQEFMDTEFPNDGEEERIPALLSG